MEKYVEIKSPFTGGKVKEVSTIENHEFRKERFSVHVRYYVCEDTGERFTTTEQDELLFNELYSQYRVKHGIPFPEEIKNVRIHYGLNYQQITKILGFGVNQYAQYEKGQRFVKVKFAPWYAPSSFVMSSPWRWLWGLFYCGSLESFTLNWSPSFPGTINMKKYKTLSRFEQVAAHEFGHILGIGDAYDAWYRFFYQMKGVSTYMMCYNRKVQNEEIEMVLRAHMTRRMQFFPYKVNIKTIAKGLKETFKH